MYEYYCLVLGSRKSWTEFNRFRRFRRIQ